LFRHGRQSGRHHLLDVAGEFIRQQIRHPDEARPASLGLHQRRALIVVEVLAHDGPAHPPACFVHADDVLARRHAVREGDEARVAFQFRIRDEAGHQPGVQRAHVT
jgi:hypothetical protein